MTLETFEIRDPERLIREVAEIVDLVEDSAYAVLVRAPSTFPTCGHHDTRSSPWSCGADVA